MTESEKKFLKELTRDLSNRIAQVERMRKALEWYASDEAWTVSQVEGADGDYGKRARAALEASDET